MAWAAIRTITPGQGYTFQNAYDVEAGASPLFINYNGIGRTVVKFDTAGSGLGKIPHAIILAYKVYGKPTGAIRMGIRKASDDSFQLIAEWPIEDTIREANGIHVVTIQGHNDYAMVANDKVSIEYPSSATNGLSIASAGSNNISGFTSQSHSGSTYSNTANALAITINARVAV